ncbi:MAG: NUDIX hydrolase [Clostridia bacterium]|nr:NUDIX hydrolase [Clostridia bacterium]
MEMQKKFLSREEIFHGRILDLRVDTVELPNGHITTREVVDHPGGVGIVAIDENDNVLTVKQYRYAFGEILEEIPAGKLERGEDPYLAALRELKEETGASCERLTPLGEVLPSPGGFGEILRLYLAEGLSFGEQNPDEDEFITFDRVPFDQLLRRCLSGEIRDGKTVAGVLKVYALRTL